MWEISSVFYQIYPFGFCGAPKENDGITVSRIISVLEWIPHLKGLGVNAIYFSPVFESDKHGYDTRDYKKIDCRLGTNEDFTLVCKILRENAIHVVFDGVFNHVGRGFFAFKLEFQIDGIRLDVAYCLNEEFMRKLRIFCRSIKEDFWLVGEILFGDYNRIVNNEMLHSCTNYECYKGLYSSMNDLNMFEISYSLNRQFGKDNNAIYSGKHLLSFVYNHDVSRVASILKERNHLPLLYGLLFTMPGIPCIYYGSEWGILGIKENDNDDYLRPKLSTPDWNDLTTLIVKLIDIHKQYKSLLYGDYKSIVLTNIQLVFQREYDGEQVWIAINIDGGEYRVYFDGVYKVQNAKNLLSDTQVYLGDGYLLPPFSLSLWKLE